jgi:hypothetical protein
LTSVTSDMVSEATSEDMVTVEHHF